MRRKLEPKHFSHISQTPELTGQTGDGRDSAVAEDAERLLRVDEVARLLGVAEGSVYHWVSASRIKGVVRLGSRCLRFQRRALMEWIESMTEKAE